jgi:hypothetical protein
VIHNGLKSTSGRFTLSVRSSSTGKTPTHATAFQIQTSDNGTTWTNVYSTETGYVRMYGTHRNTNYGYEVAVTQDGLGRSANAARPATLVPS